MSKTKTIEKSTLAKFLVFRYTDEELASFYKSKSSRKKALPLVLKRYNLEILADFTNYISVKIPIDNSIYGITVLDKRVDYNNKIYSYEKLIAFVEGTHLIVKKNENPRFYPYLLASIDPSLISFKKIKIALNRLPNYKIGKINQDTIALKLDNQVIAIDNDSIKLIVVNNKAKYLVKEIDLVEYLLDNYKKDFYARVIDSTLKSPLSSLRNDNLTKFSTELLETKPCKRVNGLNPKLSIGTYMLMLKYPYIAKHVKTIEKDLNTLTETVIPKIEALLKVLCYSGQLASKIDSDFIKTFYNIHPEGKNLSFSSDQIEDIHVLSYYSKKELKEASMLINLAYEDPSIKEKRPITLEEFYNILNMIPNHEEAYSSIKELLTAKNCPYKTLLKYLSYIELLWQSDIDLDIKENRYPKNLDLELKKLESYKKPLKR